MSDAENNTDDMYSLFVRGEFPSSRDIPLLNRKIFRGIRVTIREHPYVISIRRMYSHYLVGSLLTKNVIITVAHPVYEVPVTELRAVVGENYSDRGTCLLTVMLVVIHEEFDPLTLASDLALLRLFEDISLRLAAKTIALFPLKESMNEKSAFVTGWGRCDKTGRELCMPRSSRYYTGEIMDPMLRSIKFTVNATDRCQLYYRDIKIKPGMICMGEARADEWQCACLAVPGAPLVVAGSLAGLQSWGFGCGYVNDLPLIYTSIKHFQPWILHNLSILRNITRYHLKKIFQTTKAQGLCQWLVKTRMVIPVLKPPDLDEIYPLKVDFQLIKMNGTVYDIRDFMYAGQCRELKRDMYKMLKYEAEKILKQKQSTTPSSTVEPTNATDVTGANEGETLEDNEMAYDSAEETVSRAPGHINLSKRLKR